MNTPTPPPCPECCAINSHSPSCSSTSREELLVKLLWTQEEWRNSDARTFKRLIALQSMVTLWQGKHAIVCHENNKLRRKLYDQPTKRTTTSPRPKPSNHGRTRKNAKSS